MIDTQAKLVDFLAVVKDAPWLAIDTEADSLHAYPEKVCLIQISTSEGDRLIDPLAKGFDINPLLDALTGRELIFHAADYDLRLLRKHHDFVPTEIFDTMLAARLLGERQFGLGAIVEKFLGIKLDKGPQKADWAQRPLTPRMEEYARNDTKHLRPLEQKMREALIAKGRLAWHQESCARLIAESSVPPVIDPDEVWRIKGSSLLEPPALAVLRNQFLGKRDDVARLAAVEADGLDEVADLVLAEGDHLLRAVGELEKGGSRLVDAGIGRLRRQRDGNEKGEGALVVELGLRVGVSLPKAGEDLLDRGPRETAWLPGRHAASGHQAVPDATGGTCAFGDSRL